MSPILPEVCHRTRQHVSLRLDSELSELEEAFVTAHLARCAACRSFANDLEILTEALRFAPLAEPPVQFQLPHRPASITVTHAGTAAAAAILLAVAISGIVGFNASSTRISASDVQRAQERTSVKEQVFRALDRTDAKSASQTPPGLAAAEQTTLDRSQGATFHGRNSRQSPASSAELSGSSG